MTAYFDDKARELDSAHAFYQRRKASRRERFWQMMCRWEEALVFDVTVCAQMPGMRRALAERIHRAVIERGVECRPINAPALDLDGVAAHRHRLACLNSELHLIFHDVARWGDAQRRTDAGATCPFSDDPRSPLRAMYASGEAAREALVQAVLLRQKSSP